MRSVSGSATTHLLRMASFGVSVVCREATAIDAAAHPRVLEQGRLLCDDDDDGRRAHTAQPAHVGAESIAGLLGFTPRVSLARSQLVSHSR